MEEKEVKVVNTDNAEKHGENRCPQCGASEVTYNTKKKKLVCNYCFTEFEAEKVDGIEEKAKNLVGETRASGTQDIKEGSDDIITLKCGGCGAEVVINTATSTNARCHWCRSILSVNSQIDNGAIPDVVLPFDLEKKTAEDKIRKFVEKRQFFANPRFKKEFTTNNIMGVYFPYMLVDAKAHATFTGKGEHQTRRYTVKVSDDKEETRYDADLYKVERDFDISIDDLTIESNADRLNKKSKERTNNIINAIMPFDTENCVKYKGNYLAGYSSEKRDVNISNLEEKVDKELKDITRHAINSEIKYYDRGVKWENEEFKITGKQWVSAYLPVWLYSYQDKKKVLHYVAVNGRTGETMGSIPMNKMKLWILSLLIFILPPLICMIFGGSKGMGVGFAIFSIIIALIFLGTKNAKYNNKGARHTYEKETKHECSNIKKVDDLLEHKRGLTSASMQGANNNKIEGENVKVEKVSKTEIKEKKKEE